MDFFPNLFVLPLQEMEPCSSFLVEKNNRNERFIAKTFSAAETWAILLTFDDDNKLPQLANAAGPIGNTLSEYTYKTDDQVQGVFSISVGGAKVLSGEIGLKLKRAKSVALSLTEAALYGCSVEHEGALGKAMQKAQAAGKWEKNRRLVLQVLKCQSMVLTRANEANAEAKLDIGAAHLGRVEIGGGANKSASITIVRNPCQDRPGPFFTGYYKALSLVESKPRKYLRFVKKEGNPTKNDNNPKAVIVGAAVPEEMGADDDAAVSHYEENPEVIFHG